MGGRRRLRPGLRPAELRRERRVRPLLNAATLARSSRARPTIPDLLDGWGKRFYNWEFTAGVQHELMPRVSLNVQYARRWYGNFRIDDDRSVTAADYDRFTFPVPTDSRLPNGGGTLTAFDLKPTAPTPQNLLVTLADNYGEQTEVFDGVNVSMQARLQNGLDRPGRLRPGRHHRRLRHRGRPARNAARGGGVNPQPKRSHRGETARALPREQRMADGRFRSASYTIPKIDVQVSGTFQNQPGAPAVRRANFIRTTRAASTTTLGRAFSGAPAGQIFNIVRLERCSSSG